MSCLADGRPCAPAGNAKSVESETAAKPRRRAKAFMCRLQEREGGGAILRAQDTAGFPASGTEYTRPAGKLLRLCGVRRFLNPSNCSVECVITTGEQRGAGAGRQLVGTDPGALEPPTPWTGEIPDHVHQPVAVRELREQRR